MPKKLSEAQLLANRANAKKSTGPRTEAGKVRSRDNSFQHGLTGRRVYVPKGQEGIYDEFCQGIIDSLKPFDRLELQIARDIADAHWRLSRIRSVEDAMFAQVELAQAELQAGSDNPDDVLMAQAQLFLEKPSAFTNVTLYEQRIKRGLKSDVEELTRLQTARRERIARELPLAVKFYKVHLMQRIPFNPAEFGFVCSIDQVDTQFARELYSQRYAFACHHDFDPAKYNARYPKRAA